MLRAIAAILLAGTLIAQQTSPTDNWEPLRFLVGSWSGDVVGQPGSGRSEREYRFVLNGRFLEIRNKSTYPAQPKNPKGEVHEDWALVSYDRTAAKFVMRQFHTEGFVNHYIATMVGPDRIQFTSSAIENIPAGYRARETYKIEGADSFTETFEIAEPGKGFEVYDKTTFQRKK